MIRRRIRWSLVLAIPLAVGVVDRAATISFAADSEAVLRDQPEQTVPATGAEPSQPGVSPSGRDSEYRGGAHASAPTYYLNWYSVNGGGATHATGTNFDLGLSVGQSVAGFASGTNYKLGVGFWYGAASAACPITLSGDVNLSTTITSSDIIVLVNYVFKGGAAPLPCAANGDVNCNGAVTSSDIIVLVNFVFKGGAAPCDICTIIPSLWSCP